MLPGWCRIEQRPQMTQLTGTLCSRTKKPMPGTERVWFISSSPISSIQTLRRQHHAEFWQHHHRFTVFWDLGVKQSGGALEATTANRGNCLVLEQQERAQLWLQSRIVSNALVLRGQTCLPLIPWTNTNSKEHSSPAPSLNCWVLLSPCSL